MASSRASRPLRKETRTVRHWERDGQGPKTKTPYRKDAPTRPRNPRCPGQGTELPLNPRWEPGMGMIPDSDPRQVGDGGGDGPPILGKSGMAVGMDPRSPANRGWRWGWTPDPSPRLANRGWDRHPRSPANRGWRLGGGGDGDRGFRALARVSGFIFPIPAKSGFPISRNPGFRPNRDSIREKSRFFFCSGQNRDCTLSAAGQAIAFPRRGPWVGKEAHRSMTRSRQRLHGPVEAHTT
jgi:hypothetical protein